LWGAKDVIVPAIRSRDLIEKALVDGGNHHFTLHVFPEADHTLKVVRDAGAGWDWDRLVPEADDRMVEWLRQQTVTNSKAPERGDTDQRQ
jgi:hypothetical protein